MMEVRDEVNKAATFDWFIFFMKEQGRWMRKNIEKNIGDQYWSTLNLILLQLEGVRDGYHKVAPIYEFLLDVEIHLLQTVMDMEDVLVASAVKHQKQQQQQQQR
mmetsp:Transcript_32205/g.50397  ORF Transcript_32205/g.50397 Transcript_32205/m.50397 type:complete len:104 (-) Transcript_32205:99-410(-)